MKVLLVLNTAPALEDDLADFLLAHAAGQGFTTYEVNGHGEGLHDMSIAEQVSGRRRRVQFELALDDSAVDGLLAKIQAEVGRDVVYWQLPLQRFGRLD